MRRGGRWVRGDITCDLDKTARVSPALKLIRAATRRGGVGERLEATEESHGLRWCRRERQVPFLLSTRWEPDACEQTFVRPTVHLRSDFEEPLPLAGPEYNG